MLPALTLIMWSDMLHCFDEDFLIEVGIHEYYSKNNYNKVISFAECFTN